MTERAILLCNMSVLGVHDFRIKPKAQPVKERHQQNLNLQENEIELIRLALFNSNFNQIRAAEALGIQRMALARKLKKYNISFSEIKKWKISASVNKQE